MANFKFYDGTQWVELLKSTDISSWAKAATKPTYTASEVGAIATTGGTLTGALKLSYTTSATMTFASTNPQIEFSESGTQPVKIIYTDYDNYRSPAGLKVIGGTNASPAWFEVEGDIYEGSGGTAKKLSDKYQAKGTYAGTDVATTSANGLMSSTDKTKLDGIATGATNVTSTTVSGWGFTKNAGTVVGSGLTADQIVLGNGTTNIKISSYKPSGSGTTWDSASDVFIPTMKAIKNYVTNLGYTSNAGTVTNVATGSGLTGGPITGSGTISLASAFGDTVNPYGSKTANYVLAAPNGSAGTPSFRALVIADLPEISLDNVVDGTTRKLANYIPLVGTESLNGSIVPTTNNQRSLGSSSKNFAALYAKSIYSYDYLGLYGTTNIYLYADTSTGLVGVRGSSSYTAQLKTTNLTANREFEFPNVGGTLALNSTATQSANGLMSSTDKTKLDGIPTVGSSDKGKFLHANSSTGVLEWSSISQVPTVGSSDKNKYLHTNSSTGALEWVTISSSGMTAATASAIGAMKVGVVNNVVSGASYVATASLGNYRKFAVQLDKNQLGFVAIPFESTRYIWMHSFSITAYSTHIYFDIVGDENNYEHYTLDSDNFYGLGYILYNKNFIGDSPLTKVKTATGHYGSYPVVAVYGTNYGQVYAVYLQNGSLNTVRIDNLQGAQLYDNLQHLQLE